MSENPYENPVRLAVSFQAPENTIITLQGPALAAYYEYLEDGSDEAYDLLAEAITDQCEDHIVMWTYLDHWDNA